MPFRGADLHSHSTCSDGRETPATLVRRAVEAGLSAFALTDHDAVHGIPPFEEACSGTGIVPVAGVELSVVEGDEEIHLLGLFLDAGEPGLAGALAEVREARDRRGEAMVERLAAHGVVLDLAQIRAKVGAASFGRPHVARELVAKGHAGSMDEAFERFLVKGRPGWVPKARWSLAKGIGAVHAAGGLAVLAHPVWYGDPESLVARGKELGADGLEAVHPDHDDRARLRFSALAGRLGLLVSAGSDHHGSGEAGAEVGSCRLDEAAWEKLAAAAVERRAGSGRPPLDLSPR